MATGDDPARPDEPAVELTGEELVVLANALGVSLPVPEPESLAGDVAVRRALIDLARRSLLARRILRSDGLELTVVAPIRRLVELLAEPALVVRVGHTDDLGRLTGPEGYDPVPEDPVLVALPDVAVELRPTGAGNVRLTPFVPADLLARVAAVTGLVDRPTAPDVRAFDVAADAAAATFRLVATGKADLAAGSLLAEKVHEPSARAFVDALAAGGGAYVVEVSHRPSPNVLAGGIGSWLDGGAAGLWSLPAVEAGDPLDAVFAGPWSAPPPTRRVVTISPTSFSAVMDELFSYLPGTTF